jgi:Leu/Phe-tRNA-protein transferase
MYTNILDKYPEHIEVLNNRACVFDDLGMYENAINDLNMVITLRPEYGDAYYNRGYINSKEKFYELAVEDYLISMRLRYPKHNPRNLVTLVHGNRIDKGVETFKKLLKSGFYVQLQGNIREKIIIMRRTCDYRIVLPLKNKFHIGKTYRRHLNQHGSRYELRFDFDFDAIFNRCLHHYKDDYDAVLYLESLRKLFSALNQSNGFPRALTVALYKDEMLVAGDVGVQIGREVYSSYTGYHDISSAGTVQLILLAQYLAENGCAFLDLGPSTERWDGYKLRLGAEKIREEKYLSLFNMVNSGFGNI